MRSATLPRLHCWHRLSTMPYLVVRMVHQKSIRSPVAGVLSRLVIHLRVQFVDRGEPRSLTVLSSFTQLNVENRVTLWRIEQPRASKRVLFHKLNPSSPAFTPDHRCHNPFSRRAASARTVCVAAESLSYERLPAAIDRFQGYLRQSDNPCSLQPRTSSNGLRLTAHSFRAHCHYRCHLNPPATSRTSNT